MIPDCWIYLYHLDKFYNLPSTPDTVPNTYTSRFSSEDIMNRTAPKMTFSGSGPRTLSVSLIIHTQLFALDNPDTPSVTKDLVNALIACSYPSFNFETSKVIPPMVLIKFGEAATIRGVISSQVSCTLKEPWLKDGTLAIAEISFTVTETDQYSAEYLATFGTSPQVPTDLVRRRS